MSFSLDYAAVTDVGLVRSRNEDSGYAGPHLLAVADGMGGHAGGNVASSLVIARLAPLDGDSHGSDDALELLSRVIADANRSLASEMELTPELAGMGTTLTALMRAGANALALVHIGDSRAFLLRAEEFRQITKDHSFVQTLVDAGRITAEEAEHHPQRSLVTRVLTGHEEDEPDVSIREPRVGDRYLICSDGLSDYVARDTIAEVVGMGLPPRDTARRLVDLAMKGGAPDNVTCVIGDIVSTSTRVSLKPQIVGAAAERRAKATAPPSSPAEKAAALARLAAGTPEEDDTADEDDGRSRLWLRPLVVTLVVLLAVAAATFGAWSWSQTQWYVGQADGKVAIYRGVPQALGPIQLSSVEQTTDLQVRDLPDMWRSGLNGDLRVDDKSAAERKITEMRDAVKVCREKRTDARCGGNGS